MGVLNWPSRLVSAWLKAPPPRTLTLDPLSISP